MADTSEMISVPNVEMQEILDRTVERKIIGLSSLLAKFQSSKTMLGAAAEMSEKALENCYINEGNSAMSFCQMEAIYAACDEIIKTIQIAQKLTLRLNGSRPIPPMMKFQEAIKVDITPPSTPTEQ